MHGSEEFLIYDSTTRQYISQNGNLYSGFRIGRTPNPDHASLIIKRMYYATWEEFSGSYLMDLISKDIASSLVNDLSINGDISLADFHLHLVSPKDSLVPHNYQDDFRNDVINRVINYIDSMIGLFLSYNQAVQYGFDSSSFVICKSYYDIKELEKAMNGILDEDDYLIQKMSMGFNRIKIYINDEDHLSLVKMAIPESSCFNLKASIENIRGRIIRWY